MALSHKETAFFILERLHQKGHNALIAGGAVRDKLLQKPFHDIDILTSASLEEIQSLFSDQKTKQVGRSFPVCMVNGIEVSSGRAPADLSGFPESDLARRDFTINAMAWDPIKKIIIDPFNGRKDLSDRVIRFTREPGERIKEDPVRMIRACRFAALIGAQLSSASLSAIIANSFVLDNDTVARERIHIEILKAMTLEKPSLFFLELKKTGLLSKILPSLDRCYDQEGGPHHNETVFEHCMLVGDAISPQIPVLRLAGFLHDTGKVDAARIKDGGLIFSGHAEQTGAVLRDLGKLRFSTGDIAYIESSIKAHMRPLTDQSTPRAVRRLLSMLDDNGLDYKDFMRMRIADKKGNLAKRPYTIGEIRVRLAKLYEEIERGSVLRRDHMEISGDDIMRILALPPGPEIGTIKQWIFEKVLDDPGLNQRDELEKICLSWKTKKIN